MAAFPQLLSVTLLTIFFTLTSARTIIESDTTNSRSLKGFQLVGLYEGCPQGKQTVNTIETIFNPDNWWEKNWGRTGARWPRTGTEECWDNVGTVCALPRDQHIVCVPGSRRGSTANRGWALDPKGQSCQPGVHCLYACEPGYYWTTFNQSETSNYDAANAHQRGHCDGTWNYGTSTHGVYCQYDGTLALPDQPLCMLGETYVFAENRLDTHVFLCQTVFPGHEIFTIPTLVKAGETVMITTQPKNFWHGPTYSKPTHGDFYVGFAGADIMEACTWDEISPSGASLLPYEIGSGVEDNGAVYSTHYFYQQPNSEVPEDMVGYNMDLECESSEAGVCAPVFRNLDVVKVDVLRKPAEGTTKVKFVFKPPNVMPQFGKMYREPGQKVLNPMAVTPLRTRYMDKMEAQGTPVTFGSPSSQPVPVPSQAQAGTAFLDQTGYQTQGFGGFSNVGEVVQSIANTQAPWPFSNQFGRKLMSMESSFVYLENRLNVPTVVCGKGANGPGFTVGPGERVQLSLGDEYQVSKKLEKAIACNAIELPYVMRTGDASEDIHSSYSVQHNTKALDRGQHVDYKIVVRCTSNGKLCKTSGGNRVDVLGDPSKDSSLEVTYIVNPISSEAGNEEMEMNDVEGWGEGIIKLMLSPVEAILGQGAKGILKAES